MHCSMTSPRYLFKADCKREEEDFDDEDEKQYKYNEIIKHKQSFIWDPLVQDLFT